MQDLSVKGKDSTEHWIKKLEQVSLNTMSGIKHKQDW